MKKKEEEEFKKGFIESSNTVDALPDTRVSKKYLEPLQYPESRHLMQVKQKPKVINLPD